MRDEVAGRLRVGCGRGDHRDDGGVARGVDARWRDAGDARRVPQRGEERRRDLAVLRDGHDDGERSVDARPEALREQFERLVLGSRRRRGPVVGLPVPDGEERRGQRKEHDDGADRAGPAMARDGRREAGPEGRPARVVRRGRAVVPDVQPADAERVDARPRETEERGEQGDRRDHHHRDDQRGREPEDRDIGDPGEREPADRDDDRCSREDHGLPGRRDRVPGRGVDFHPVAQVLAMSRDDEQRVVDADAESDHRPEVGGHGPDVDERGEQRDAGDADGEPEECRPDRQAGGDEGPECDDQDEHRDQQTDGVARVGVVDVRVVDERAAELHVEAGLRGRSGRGLEHVEPGRPERRREHVVLDRREPDCPVLRRQRGGERTDRPDDLRRVRELLERADAVRDGGLVRRRRECPGAGLEHDRRARPGLLCEAAGEEVGRGL